MDRLSWTHAAGAFGWPGNQPCLSAASTSSRPSRYTGPARWSRAPSAPRTPRTLWRRTLTAFQQHRGLHRPAAQKAARRGDRDSRDGARPSVIGWCLSHEARRSARTADPAFKPLAPRLAVFSAAGGHCGGAGCGAGAGRPAARGPVARAGSFGCSNWPSPNSSTSSPLGWRWTLRGSRRSTCSACQTRAGSGLTPVFTASLTNRVLTAKRGALRRTALALAVAQQLAAAGRCNGRWAATRTQATGPQEQPLPLVRPQTWRQPRRRCVASDGCCRCRWLSPQRDWRRSKPCSVCSSGCAQAASRVRQAAFPMSCNPAPKFLCVT